MATKKKKAVRKKAAPPSRGVDLLSALIAALDKKGINIEKIGEEWIEKSGWLDAPPPAENKTAASAETESSWRDRCHSAEARLSQAKRDLQEVLNQRDALATFVKSLKNSIERVERDAAFARPE